MNKTNNKSVIQLEFNVVDNQYKWELKKSLLDSYIDKLKKYDNYEKTFGSYDRDLLLQLEDLERNLNIRTGFHAAIEDIIIAMCSDYDGRKFTNQDIYNVLNVLGYEIVEGEC